MSQADVTHTLPPELWEYYILPNLSPKDALAFSSVSKRANELVRSEVRDHALYNLRIKNGQLSRFLKLQKMLPKDLVETLIQEADNYAAGRRGRSNTICLYPNENHIVLYTAHETSEIEAEDDGDGDDDHDGDEPHWYSWAGPAPADVAEANHMLNDHLTAGGTVAAWTIDTVADNDNDNDNDNNNNNNPLGDIDYGLSSMSDDDDDDEQ